MLLLLGIIIFEINFYYCYSSYIFTNLLLLKYMPQIIKRRQFVQLMFANAVATTVLGNLAHKSFASNKTLPQLVYGVRVTSGRVLLLCLDLASGQIQDLSATTPELNLLPNERLSSFTLLSNGTFVLATAPATATITGQSDSLSRLLSFSSPQTLPPLQGLERNSTVESLLGTMSVNCLV
jgi:hypothetical protein